MPAIKYSRQREAVKRYLMTRRDHPTAEAVYSAVRDEFPNISLGTVYRNLSLLADLGEIARIRVGDGLDHFDPDTLPHAHFVCTECGGVSDLRTDVCFALDALDGQTVDGSLITGHAVLFYGICGKCREKPGSPP